MSVTFEPEIVPSGTVGADIRGVDLACVSEAQVEAIKRAWYRHDVLVFRNQEMTDDDLLAFSRQFGALDPPPNQGAGRRSPLGYPDIYVISNVLDDKGEPIGALGDGDAAWHTDMSYLAQPPDASMLYSLEIPKQGGDTWFCGMKAALAKMPKPLVERIKDLDVKHDGTYDSAGYVRKGITPSKDPRTSVGTPHPMVIRHPESGDAALYLGRRLNAYIMGMEVAESERLLDEVWSYVDSAVYKHRWALGDLVLWDNRTTMHRRDAFDPKSRRVMARFSRYSGLIPASRITAAQLLSSIFTTRSSSSGLPPTGSAPCSMSFCFTSGRCTTRAISFCMRATIAAGVFAGANIAHQESTS